MQRMGIAALLFLVRIFSGLTSCKVSSVHWLEMPRMVEFHGSSHLGSQGWGPYDWGQRSRCLSKPMRPNMAIQTTDASNPSSQENNEKAKKAGETFVPEGYYILQ